MFFGHLNAQHGVEFVNDLSKITDAVQKLASSMIKFAEKVKLVDGITWAFKELAKVIDYIADKLNKFQKFRNGLSSN